MMGPKSIRNMLVQFAIDEGKIDALAKAEGFRDVIEQLAEIGTPYEQNAAAVLAGSVGKAIEGILNLNVERRITEWHGESGTVYYVLAVNTEKEEEWEVLASFKTRKEAEEFVPA